MGALTYNTGFVKKLTGRDANMPAEVEPDKDDDEIEPITTVSDSEKKKKKAPVAQLFIPDSALKED
tara:strand:- start:663 stop:860 length:198 start_codon:yes stop_codon:yes gene_type:complete